MKIKLAALPLVGVMLAASACGGSTPTSAAASSTPAPIVTVTGQVVIPFVGADLFVPDARDTTVPPGPFAKPTAGDPCVGLGAYADVEQNATVAITGDTGQTLAMASLDPGIVGSVRKGTEDVYACLFLFNTTVPGGQRSYTVKVGQRDPLTYTAQQIAQPLAISVGS